MDGSVTSLTGGGGVYVVGDLVENVLGWFYRNQPDHDFGIDGQIESAVDDRPSGRLLAVQLKSSRTKYSDTVGSGWWHTVKASHAKYWLGHSLPVVLLLVDIPGRMAYWEHINSSTLVSTGKHFKVWVPATQQLVTAKAEWERLIDGSVERAIGDFEQNLEALPPSTAKDLRQVHADHPVTASQIAAVLAAHSAEPRKALESVLKDHRGWLNAGGRSAWMAVAHFGQEHHEFLLAGKAFKKVGDLYEEGRATAWGVAASMFSDLKPKRAKKLLKAAAALDPDSLVVAAVTVTVFRGKAEPDSPDYDAALMDRLVFATDSETALFLRAALANIRRDENEAIRLYEAALVLMPDASDAMVQLAELYCRRKLTPDWTAGDLDRALMWAERALTQRRRWTSDTEAALAALVRALGLQNRFDEALRFGAPPPYGQATPEESASARVAMLMIEVAEDAGKPQLREPIIAAVPDERTRKSLQVQSNLSGVTEDDRRLILQELLVALDPDDLETRLAHAFRLATLGVNASEQFLGDAAAGRVPEYFPRLLAAIARSIEDPAGALFDLRYLADIDTTAATALVNLYGRAGRYKDALTAAARASMVFGSGEFVEREVYFLFRLDREAEAQDRLRNAIRGGEVTGKLRDEFLLTLGKSRMDAGDFVEAARYFEQVAPRSEPGAWCLAWCEYETGHYQGARNVIDQFSLIPDDIGEIRLWAAVAQTTGWSAQTAELACELAGRLAETDAELAVTMLSSVISLTRGVAGDESDLEGSKVDARPRVPGDVHRRAFELIDAITSAKALPFPVRKQVADDSFAEIVAELARPGDPKALQHLVNAVLFGAFPMAVLADGLNKSYAMLICSGGMGPIVASTPNADEHETETETARDYVRSRGRVVVDASAVSLASTLGEYDRLRLLFQDVLFSMRARHDVARALMDARSFTASSGSLGWDEFSQRPTFTEADPAHQLRTLQRAELLERAVERLTSLRLPGPPRFTAEFVEQTGEQVWLETIELTGQTGAALWSDDAAHRRFARALGVPCFGTVNLLEALLLEEWNESANPLAIDEYLAGQRDLVRTLIRTGVVDQPCRLSELLALIRSDDGPGEAHRVLARPVWWSEQGTVAPWAEIRPAVVESLGDDIARRWLFAAIDGVAAATAGQAEMSTSALGTLAIVGTEERPDPEQAAWNLRYADRAASSHDSPPPSESLDHLAEVLAAKGVLIDAEDFAALVRDKLAETVQ